MNLSSSLILNLNFLYEEDHDLFLESSPSATSIESSFSAVILSEDYESHLFSSEKGAADTDSYEEKNIKRNNIQNRICFDDF